MSLLFGVRPVHLADLVLGALAAEAALLSLHPGLKRRLPPRCWLPGVLAGAGLAGALRCALSGAAPVFVVLCLAAALPAHLAELVFRFHDRSAGDGPPN